MDLGEPMSHHIQAAKRWKEIEGALLRSQIIGQPRGVKSRESNAWLQGRRFLEARPQPRGPWKAEGEPADLLLQALVSEE
jgi:hypothetical protein